MDLQTMTLNGQKVEFAPGQTILEVAEANGIEIPTLCRLKGVPPTGACRVCLVEIRGAENLATSCNTPAGPGMVVETESEDVVKARRLVIELMMASGEHNCMTCEANGDCVLQDLAYRYGVEAVSFPRTPDYDATEDANPLIIRDFSKCVLCGRCVQACNEVQVNLALAFRYDGAKSKIITTVGDVPLEESRCVFCGECVQACPVGALTEKKARHQGRSWEMTKVRTTCPYCGVGCQLWLHVKDGRIVKVTGVEDGAPNQGRLCVKGRFGYDFIYSDERLTTPLIRKDGELVKASWDEALDLVADKFKEVIAKHGPDAVAGVSCARSINEDSYNMQKLFRSVFRTNNIDHCART